MRSQKKLKFNGRSSVKAHILISYSGSLVALPSEGTEKLSSSFTSSATKVQSRVAGSSRDESRFLSPLLTPRAMTRNAN